MRRRDYLNKGGRMGDIEINVWAVVLAALSSFVVGMIWYSKPLFGKSWMKLTGMTEKKAQEAQSKAMISAGISAVLISAVLAGVTYMHNTLFGGSYVNSAVMSALLLGVGLQATVIVLHDGFEQRPLKLSLMNAGNQVTNLVVMGLIIGLMGV